MPDTALSSWQGAATTTFSPVEESKYSPLTPCPSVVRFWERVPEESKLLLLGGLYIWHVSVCSLREEQWGLCCCSCRAPRDALCQLLCQP